MVEGLVLSLAVVGLLAHPSIVRVLRATTTQVRRTAGVLALALIVAQVAKSSNYTFPFVDWRMFGRCAEAPRGLRFTAIRADGSSERIFLGATISDATVWRIDGLVRKQLALNSYNGLQRVIDAAIAADSIGSARSPVVMVLISDCSATVEKPKVTRCKPPQMVSVGRQKDRP